MSQRFLCRLGSDEREVDEWQSIAEHLQTLLNSREGVSATTPDFGLPDLTDIVHMLPDGVHAIQDAIRDVLLKYEPRLAKVKVRFAPSEDAFVLYFDVSARRSDGDKAPFRVRTSMHPGNRFRVSR
ncbi:MAG: type VI secretion system baseplate subunit TssE [Myxococcota bacterium]